MKTTNNKLLDNTGNPVSHNRPTIKLVEWEVRTKSDFLLWNSPDDTAIWDGERTGNTREVERPMNDTEYIEYLEKENQELKEHNINQRKAFAILLNEEEDKYKKEFRELNDKLLKVVESVLDCHIHMNDKCSCGWESETDTFNEHLLQEIKSVIESTNLPESQDKSTNLEQVQDKKGKDEKEK